GQVAEVGAGHADHAPGDLFEVHVVGEGLVTGVDLEDLQSPLPGGPVDGDVPVEASGAKQGGVEDVGPVGGGHDDDGLGGGEAVHLAEDLVEGLLALVGAAAEAGAAHPADGVDLIDEDNAIMCQYVVGDERVMPVETEVVDEINRGQGLDLLDSSP